MRNAECGMRNAECGMWNEECGMKNNVIVEKSKTFALRVIKMYKYLVDTKKEFVMAKQVLRSGTSIGANIREAQRGQSKPDFYAKLNIALKEAEETAYWLELLHESGFVSPDLFESIYADCQEVIRLLVSITATQRSKSHP